MPLIQDPPPIDLEVGTQLIGGDRGKAIEILKLVIEQLPNTVIKIKNCAKSAKKLNYEVDYLLSSTCYCGLPRLNQAANNLLNHLKAIKSPKHKLIYESLLQEVDNVLTYYERIKSTLEDENTQGSINNLLS